MSIAEDTPCDSTSTVKRNWSLVINIAYHKVEANSGPCQTSKTGVFAKTVSH